MVVARGVDNDPGSRHGNVLVIAVPTTKVEVLSPYRKVGAGPLGTAAVQVDTWVPADHLVARAGTGLAAISWGLAHERMSIAGQVASSCQRGLSVTHARMVQRRQSAIRRLDMSYSPRNTHLANSHTRRAPVLR